MRIPFVKMHGLGNDYVFVNCFHHKVTRPAALAPRISDRHTGVGSDGLILMLPSRRAAVRMRIFNADGSEAETCGNGLRCLARLAWEEKLVTDSRFDVETRAGVVEVEVHHKSGRVRSVTVDMGEPRLAPEQIPVNVAGAGPVLDLLVPEAGRHYRFACVSMGNPHAVCFVPRVAAVALERVGPAVEHSALFPQRTNVEFVQALGRGTLRLRVWERGSGVTLACGSGACAAAVAAYLTGRAGRRVRVELALGVLDIEWREANGHVYMTGPATRVCEGVYAPS